MADLVGRILRDRYRVDKLLGRGGMSEVYKVWDTHRMTPLAMKVLREDLALDKVFLRRFAREAETLAKLQHPNIVRFYGLEQEGRIAFMLLDFVEGESLKHLIFDSQGNIPESRVVSLLQPVLSALHYAHSRGMVHCDVKPANIMLDNQGHPLLADFGIARMTEAATTTMVGIGTPAYMAPEQIHGDDPLPQTDIYSIGVIMYEMLTGGERPFTGDQAAITGSTSQKVRWEHLELSPTPPSQHNSDISQQMEAVVMQCLEKDPGRRFSTAMELLQALDGATDAPLKEYGSGEVFGSEGTIGHPPKTPQSELWKNPRNTPASKNPFLIMGSVLTVLVVVMIIMVAFNSDDSDRPGLIFNAPTENSISTERVSQPLIESNPPTQTSRPEPTNTPKPEKAPWRPCPDAYPTQLKVGIQAYVSFDPPLANNVREAPGLDAEQVGQIQPGETITITGGPACSNNWVWWKIKSLKTGLVGWTSEGDENDYWILPQD